MSRAVLAFALVFAAVVATGPAPARADGGEAGLVIQHGDGTTETFCIPFSGDGIRGDDLLRRAGVPVEQFSGLVCSLGTVPGEGCPGASSFDSCTCKCQGTNCVYWAFFSQSYGRQWVYSALGFNLQKARDGDLHGWKWGKGSASSAPAPAAVSFEQVCGHPPRGGDSAATPVLPATPPPAAVATEPSASATFGPSPPDGVRASTTSSAASPPSEQFTPLPPLAPVAVTPVAAVPSPATNRGGGPARGAIAFAGVAAVLVAALGAALFWRRSRGA